MSYTKLVLDVKESYEAELVDLVCSMYDYYHKALTYFVKTNPDNIERDGDEMIVSPW